MGAHPLNFSVVKLTHLGEGARDVKLGQRLFCEGHASGRVRNPTNVVEYFQRLHSVDKAVNFSSLHFVDDFPAPGMVAKNVLGAVDIIGEDEVVLPVDF